MNRLLSKDTTFRIASVVFAILLWFFVLSDVNPVQRADIVVPLVIENRNSLDMKSLGLKGQITQRDVVVTIEDRSQRIKTITSNDISAVIDLSDIEGSGFKDLNINVNSIKEGVKIKQVLPQTVRVSVEGTIEKAFNIEISPELKLKENFIIVRNSVSPQAINVSGLESVITSIASVKAIVKDINDLDKNLTLKTDCYFYNQKGEELFDFNKKYYVDIKLEVAKKVSIMPVVKGTPAKDFYEGEIAVSPKTVLISGTSELLNQISELKVETVDIENVSSSVYEMRRIFLPDGVKLVDSPQEVEVSVIINKMPIRDYSLLKSSIEIINGDTNTYKYEIVPTEAIVKLIGTPNDHKNVVNALLKPQINVSGLTEGTYKVPISVTLPPNIRLTGEAFVEVTITKVNKTPT